MLSSCRVKFLQHRALYGMHQDFYPWFLWNVSFPNSKTITKSHLNISILQKIWNNLVPLKVNAFSWRLILNMIPSKFSLVRRKIFQLDQINCVACDDHVEDSTHFSDQINDYFLIFVWQKEDSDNDKISLVNIYGLIAR